VLDVSLYTPEMLIFLDETGSDRRDCMDGCSLHGKPLVSQRLLVRVKRINCIAFMSMEDLLDCKTMACTVDSDKLTSSRPLCCLI
jgi:hypothetical protein